jgi:hypothetical protein
MKNTPSDLDDLDLEDEEEYLNEDGNGNLPDFPQGQAFEGVTASVTEHFTSPPKPYTEDTLLAAMERAGAENMPEDTERKGLGTPATRAVTIEKLVAAGFVELKGKSCLPLRKKSSAPGPAAVSRCMKGRRIFPVLTALAALSSGRMTVSGPLARRN